MKQYSHKTNYHLNSNYPSELKCFLSYQWRLLVSSCGFDCWLHFLCKSEVRLETFGNKILSTIILKKSTSNSGNIDYLCNYYTPLIKINSLASLFLKNTQLSFFRTNINYTTTMQLMMVTENVKTKKLILIKFLFKYDKIQ